jgi:UDP-N-acetylmuramoyl-L-alanyl-D-glutamate--2,6-diaminopimelate ligase
VTDPARRPAATPEVPLGRLAAAAASGIRVGAQDVAEAGEVAALPVRGVTLDSRQVGPGDLYAALPGARAHGAQFADQAAARGAVAVLTDPAGTATLVQLGPPADQLPVIEVADPRAVLGPVAATAYGDPTHDLQLLGVTGTNGKTTVAFMLEAGLIETGRRTGLIGTVVTRIGELAVPSVRTTPEAPELQALLASMRERDVEAAAMEVSSHALALHRVDGCRFAGAAFTNLSQDHLDFHPTLEDYFEAKAGLFDPARGFLPPGAPAVINVDDPWGRQLAARLPRAATFGSAGSGARWQAAELQCGPSGSEFVVLAPTGERVRARVQLPGQFNVSNALCAIALLVETGTPIEAAVAGVAGLAGVPGRMERVDAGQPFLAVVDYAHTPAAVAGVLATVRELTAGRVVVVLGCGGDRDRGKRPLMGAAAVEGADIVVLTSDNPRSEDPLAILAEMQAGASAAQARRPGVRVVVEPDRAAAISRAAALARPGDAVVVAGKGHESGQDIGGVVHPFDDRAVLRVAIEQTAPAGAAS